jgi:hypothetical protein
MEEPKEVEATEVVAEAEEPPTPSHKTTREEPVERPVPTLDADFWGSMLNTKREMDHAAKKARYSNLVVFK